MADQPSKQDTVFKFEKVYLKDISFESPNAPAIFANPKEQEVGVEFNIAYKPIDEEKRYYEVVLTMKVAATQDEKPSFIVEVQQGGVFQIVGVSDEELPSVLEVSCPNMLMPFAREVICDLVVKGGFPQLLIDPVNFQALYDQKQPIQRQE